MCALRSSDYVEYTFPTLSLLDKHALSGASNTFQLYTPFQADQDDAIVLLF